MKKNIEWLKSEILELSIKARHKENNQREWHMGHEMALFDVNKLIDQLDEPETLSEEWIENHTASADTISYYSDESVPVVVVEKLKNLLVPKQGKPVIPQFVAEYIEQSKKDNDSINQVFAFMDDKEDKDLWHWLFPSMYEEKRANQEVFMRAWLDGYEVEKEKLYRVRAGNRYVRFNLDGSIIGVKKDNSIVCLERLSKLPFDYKKAVESGIITLEEVTE